MVTRDLRDDIGEETFACTKMPLTRFGYHSMKILLVTDAWHPQMNGVVRTLDTTVSLLRAKGYIVE